MVKDWKDETRKLQQKKLQEKRMKGYVGELHLLTGESSLTNFSPKPPQSKTMML